MLEERVNRVFGDEAPKGFGTGWWSGVLSAFFGFLSFGAVLCLHYPAAPDRARSFALATRCTSCAC